MKFLIIGESCLDRFFYGAVNRICPEAPVPVFEPDSNEASSSNYGMASNVKSNLHAIKSHFKERDFNVNFSYGYCGHKDRYVDSESKQMLIRIDFLMKPARIILSKDVIESIKSADCVIISDYNRGFLKIEDIEFIAKNSKLSFLDTKKAWNEKMRQVDFIKINQHEFDHGNFPESLENLIVTSGSKGCWTKDKNYPIENKKEIRDVCGAGDTFLAAFSYHYTYNQSNPDVFDLSISFAQECCQKVISKSGVSTI